MSLMIYFFSSDKHVETTSTKEEEPCLHKETFNNPIKISSHYHHRINPRAVEPGDI